VVDTNVFGAELVPNSKLAVLYEPLLAGRAVLISFQTAAELRYGALLRGWGPARMLKLEARINAAETVHSGPELIDTYARLRVPASVSATPWPSGTTTPTGGSQRPPYGSACRSCPTTGSSKESPDWLPSAPGDHQGPRLSSQRRPQVMWACGRYPT
jgi:hypothetical protein